MSRRKNAERDERTLQRREREDAAGKLLKRVPDLLTLSLAVSEARADVTAGGSHYIRRIVVEHAPALFEIPCSYTFCKEGGYDVTREVMAALLARKTRFEGDCACRGSLGNSGECSRVLQYVGTATYKPLT